MNYVDGFVIPVPKKNLSAYMKMAKFCAKIWREHGALHVCEAAGEELNTKCGLPFPATIKCKPNETVVFSWIVFKSKAHRNSVNAKVMKDPRLAQWCEGKLMPFDCTRMIYGGFKAMVDE